VNGRRQFHHGIPNRLRRAFSRNVNVVFAIDDLLASAPTPLALGLNVTRDLLPRSHMTIVETRQSRCLVGVARGDITPPVGIYHRMWGAATHDRSTGVHRPLTATVLVLRNLHGDETEPQVVIGVDHCLLWTPEMNALLDSVSGTTGISRSALTVFFSHTHAAGLMDRERRDLPGGEMIEPYLNDLARRIAELVIDASERCAPSTIVYGTGRCDLATNRDFFDVTRGHPVCGFNPSGRTDDTVLVSKVVSDAGQTLATLVNYACHPTTLAWENTLISPDFVGAMREVIETATAAPCLFIQGASGDIGPRDGFVGDVTVADRNGRQLGYAALSTIESLPAPGHHFEYAGPVVSGATLGTWKHVPESAERLACHAVWSAQTGIVPLLYRSDLPTRDALNRELAHFQSEEAKALAASDPAAARDARAMIERAKRRMTRVGHLPPGDSYPYPIVLWRCGDAVWIALDGEHYNVLQRTLRQRFPNTPLVIGTLANGSNVWYLPDAASYGKGLYQEEVSILKRGCLEAVIDAATTAITQILSTGGPASPSSKTRGLN
jgi:Neutral/alkaline non-lysosomal ceramidase, N-terminal